ncbi:transporter substrate-binding domain-containing protein [Aliiglaciecola sp. CAU 1673]|nr:transporter substrate-binding domain-containing protein [Aliiglaciecola sp. CAU 1673]
MTKIGLLLCTLFFALPLKAQCILKVRVNYAPPQYFNEQDKWTGIAVEMVEALLQEAGCKAEYHKLPWQRAIMELEKGTIDIMMNVGYSDSRAQHYYFISPDTYEEQVLVTRNDAEIEIETLDDLISLPLDIVYEKGVIFDQAFTDKLSSSEAFSQKVVPSAVETNFESVYLKRLSGAITTYDFAAYMLKKNPKYSQELRILPLKISSVPTFFALSKKSVSKERFLAFQEANIRLISRGTYRHIIASWRSLQD